jgi:hypothetical protein
MYYHLASADEACHLCEEGTGLAATKLCLLSPFNIYHQAKPPHAHCTAWEYTDVQDMSTTWQGMQGVPKAANKDHEEMLIDLVFAVQLVNATRYSTPESAEPAGTPQEPSSRHFLDLFDAVLDPFFDEDVYMGSDELFPVMPLGDHC